MATFVDTTAWAAVKNRKDRNYLAAVEVFTDLAERRERVVTTDFVLDETYTLLLYEVGYTTAVQFKRDLDAMIRKGTVELVQVTPEVQIEAWAVFERFNRDKLWSFTDCTSYVVMRREGLAQAASFDEDFAQMGFVLRPGVA